MRPLVTRVYECTHTHTRYANIRRMFPGLGLGVAAFLVLVAVEEFYWKPNHPDDSNHH